MAHPAGRDTAGAAKPPVTDWWERPGAFDGAHPFVAPPPPVRDYLRWQAEAWALGEMRAVQMRVGYAYR